MSRDYNPTSSMRHFLLSCHMLISPILGTHIDSNYPIQTHTPPHALGLHKDNSIHSTRQTLNQWRYPARLASMVPDSLARLEDEQEGG